MFFFVFFFFFEEYGAFTSWIKSEKFGTVHNMKDRGTSLDC